MAAHGNGALTVSRLEDAMFRTPKDPFRCFEAAALYYKAGDAVSSRSLLLKALSLEPGFVRARAMLAEAAAAGGYREPADARLKNMRATPAKTSTDANTSLYDRALLAPPETGYTWTGSKIWRKR